MQVKFSNFRIRTPHPKILLFESYTQVDHNKAFVRIQEFYESTYPEINGKYFTLAAYKKCYAKDHGGRFTYNTDWLGHNIPEHVVRNFYKLFGDDKLTTFEAELKALLIKRKLLYTNKKFCIIACELFDNDTRRHELAHALWNLHPEYKYLMELHVENLAPSMYDALLADMKKDYVADAWHDEMHAYIATSGIEELVDGHKIPIGSLDLEGILAIKQIFKQYMQKWNLK